MADMRAEAANNVIAWLQGILRKSGSAADDAEEDLYMDPCQFLMDNFADIVQQQFLCEGFQTVLASLGDNPLPITTVGCPVAR